MLQKLLSLFSLVILLLSSALEPAMARAGGRYSSGGGSRGGYSSHYSSQGSRGSRTYDGGSSNGRSYAPVEKSATQRQPQNYQNQAQANNQNTQNSYQQQPQNSSFFQRNPMLSTFGAALAGSWVGHMLFGSNGYYGNNHTNQDAAQAAAGSSGGGMLINILIMALGGLLVFMLVRSMTRSQTPIATNNNVFHDQNFGIEAAKARQNQRNAIEIYHNDETKKQFSNMFVDIQTAWSNQNINALKQLTSAEMFKYFSDALSQNFSQGLENKIENITSLELDITESWREDDMEYATAFISWSCFDYTISADKKIVDGSNEYMISPSEAWTFTRYNPVNNTAGKWLLSAIQQVS